MWVEEYGRRYAKNDFLLPSKATIVGAGAGTTTHGAQFIVEFRFLKTHTNTVELYPCCLHKYQNDNEKQHFPSLSKILIYKVTGFVTITFDATHPADIPLPICLGKSHYYWGWDQVVKFRDFFAIPSNSSKLFRKNLMWSTTRTTSATAIEV